MARFEQQLAEEATRAEEAHKRRLAELQRRKEDIAKEARRQQLQEIMNKKKSGATKEEIDDLTKRGEEERQRLEGRLEADRLRMEAQLREKRNKRLGDRRRGKQQEVCILQFLYIFRSVCTYH